MSQLPLFPPASDWVCPTELPIVPRNRIVTIDVETKDPGLARDAGSSWAWLEGYIIGVSVAWTRPDSQPMAVYLPVRHPDTANFPPSNVFRWLRGVMGEAKQLVFHRAGYDLAWLSTEGIGPNEFIDKVEDTYVAAVMLDENRLSYSLDALCKAYGVPAKDETRLRETAATYGVDAKTGMWQMPATGVGRYAEQDALSTAALFSDLYPQLSREDLTDAYRLEVALTPMVIAMRQRGIRVDLDRAREASWQLILERDNLLRQLTDTAGEKNQINIKQLNSPWALGRIFDHCRILYNRTPKANQPQFQKVWLEAHPHPVAQAVVKIKALHSLATKFIDTYILENQRKGFIHAEIHQLRDDSGGTRSYRFSYSNPPLQQMPKRRAAGGGDERLAKIVRQIFVPEEGEQWCDADYSQQEPRLTVHFAAVACLSSSQAAVDYYHNSASPDFHQMVADLVGIPREPAKIINLGLAYGMGLEKLASSLGLTLIEAEKKMDEYNAGAPFVRDLNDFCKRRADRRGYIRLLDGARCRFNLWSPGYSVDDENQRYALPYETAKKRWPDKFLKRAFTHKAMNRLIQGSAARQTKIAMLQCWKEGILPVLQLHDALHFSVNEPTQVRRIINIMETCVSLLVPVKVDAQLGNNWGDVVKVKQEALDDHFKSQSIGPLASTG